MRNVRGARPGSMLLRSATLAAAALCAAVGGAQQVVIPPPPILVQSDRYEVVVVTQRSIGTLTDDARVGRMLAGCARALRIAPQDSAAAVRQQAWDWTAGPSRDPLTITFVLLPSEPLYTSCPDRETQDRIAAVRGLRITYDSTYAPERDIERVALWRGEERIVPTLSERAAIARLIPRGLISNGAGGVRVSVPIAALEPDATGRRTDLTLEVWNERDTLPDMIPLPWPVVVEAWHDVIAWRAAQALAAGATSLEGVMTTPVPKDDVLRASRQQYLQADFAGANAALIPQMIPAKLGRSDYRNARVQLALTFANVGDSAAARVLMGDVIRDEPCFTLANDAPPHAERLMEGLHRPAARCKAASMLRTAAQSAVLPGFGRPMGWQRMLGGAVAVAVIGATLNSGFSKLSSANKTYEEYLRMDYTISSNPAALSRILYENAEQERSAAAKALTIGAVVWGATIAESLIHEALLARRLSQVREYGRGATRGVTRGLTLVPRASASQVGLALNFF